MAEPTEIIDALESLALHCRPPIMSVEDRSRWMRDWCEDLRSYPAEAIRTATSRWRHGAVQKFPTAGQFLPLVRTATPAPPTASTAKAKAWSELEDCDYDQLTLAEKVRHHRILASELNAKAAREWRRLPETLARKPPSFSDWQSALPADWARFRSQEVNHLYEADRLKKKLQGFREP